MAYFESRAAVVEYVADLMHTFGQDWPLTMIITPEKSEGYSVQIVTDTSLADKEQEQVASFFSQTQVNT